MVYRYWAYPFFLQHNVRHTQFSLINKDISDVLLRYVLLCGLFSLIVESEISVVDIVIGSKYFS